MNINFEKFVLDKSKKIAFINSFCMGDNLIGLVTVHNLYLNGYQVDVYGNYSYDLQQWFPWIRIFPSIKPETLHLLKDYYAIIYMYEHEFNTLRPPHKNYIILSCSPIYRLPIPMIDIQCMACKTLLQLQNIFRTNGIVPLDNLVARKNNNRIIIHPTSSIAKKDWPKFKFLQLARYLEKDGYEPNFIVSPKERSEWQDVLQTGYKLPEFTSLSDVAAFVYESGYFIGNDSGIGHLASNLGIPTVTIVLRKGVARQWRPSWTYGEIVLSPFWLNPRPLKERFWKKFISVAKVYRTFKHLVKEYKSITI